VDPGLTIGKQDLDSRGFGQFLHAERENAGGRGGNAKVLVDAVGRVDTAGLHPLDALLMQGFETDGFEVRIGIGCECGESDDGCEQSGHCFSGGIS
jgi:hypothetical protein